MANIITKIQEIDRRYLVILAVIIALILLIIFIITRNPNPITDKDVSIKESDTEIQVSVQKLVTDDELTKLQTDLQAKNPDKKVTVEADYSYSQESLELTNQRASNTETPNNEDLYADPNAID